MNEVTIRQAKTIVKPIADKCGVTEEELDAVIRQQRKRIEEEMQRMMEEDIIRMSPLNRRAVTHTRGINLFIPMS